MKVFCPNCGQANETGPGTRVMCTACTAVFEAPADASGGAGASAGAPPPADVPAPVAAPPAQQQWGQFQQPGANPYSQPAPYNPGQPTNFGNSGVQTNNTLAIVSLVLGIACCIPFASIAAIITGAIAIKQIDENPSQSGKGMAIAGIVLGSLSLVVGIIYAIAMAAGAGGHY